jgi:spermidine synthase
MRSQPNPLTAPTSASDLRPVSQTATPDSSSATPRWALPLLSLAFVLSGAAGLIYESIWTRYLGLFVGHSAYAQIIVLVIFLGGMSIGAFVVGERSSRVRHPLFWYAGVEAAVGVIGLVFHDIFTAATGAAYDHWFPALAGGLGITVVKWGLAGLLILPQSILLGTTFPLMSAGVMRLRSARPGHVLGLLYFANSLGAAVGVLVAGFALLALVGLPGTLLTAALLNFAVAIAVGLPVRGGYLRDVDPLDAPVSSREGDRSSGGEPRTLWRLLLLVSFGTAVSSFVYEIGWIRMLSLVLGSATHSFELMLSAFILGLALGAFWVRRRADGFTNPVRTLGVVQWVMGVLAICTLPLYVSSWTATLLRMLQPTDTAYSAYFGARYVICLLVMVPATFCAGMTLPLITKTLIQAGAGERSIGAVYGVNTFGSIIGAALAGLVLMPLLGLKWLLVSGALIDIVIGAVLLARAPRQAAVRPGAWATRARIGAIATLAVVVAIAVFARFDRSIITSGVYRHAGLPDAGTYDFPFYKDGRTATVSVRRLHGDSTAILTLSTNGKPDASVEDVWRRPVRPGAALVPLTHDLCTQVMLPLVALAHASNARQAAVIGQGSGMTSHFLLGSDRLERLYTIEIEPEMIKGSRVLMPANRRVFEDPRSTFIIDDAKSFFAANNRKFDLILSEPSNPWVSGVSGLFTTEFYQRVSRQLAPGGVFGQWLHLYEIDDVLVLSVLAAIDRTFPAYEVFLTSNVDMLVVATNAPRLPDPDWSVTSMPGVREDLSRVIPFTTAALEDLRIGGRSTLHPYLARPTLIANSDFFPILDLGTERTRFLHVSADGITSLGIGRFDAIAALAGRRQPLAPPHLAPSPEVPRVKLEAIASQLRVARSASAATIDTISDNSVRAELYRMQLFERGMSSGAAPLDWRLWTQDFFSVEENLHSGSAGDADEAFYANVRAYLTRARAPKEARDAVDFMHGLATWSWDEVDHAGESLVATLETRRQSWAPTQLLREGLAVSRLMHGDKHGVSAVFHRLARYSDGPATFRDRVIAAHAIETSAAPQLRVSR